MGAGGLARLGATPQHRVGPATPGDLQVLLQALKLPQWQDLALGGFLNPAGAGWSHR